MYERYWHNDDDPISDNMDIDGRLQTLDFIKCYFSNDNWQNDSYTAAEQSVTQIYGDIWQDINLCVKSGEIDGIFAKLKEKVEALSPPLTYTPWITVNKNHSTEAEDSLLSAVCDTYSVN